MDQYGCRLKRNQLSNQLQPECDFLLSISLFDLVPQIRAQIHTANHLVVRRNGGNTIRGDGAISYFLDDDYDFERAALIITRANAYLSYLSRRIY